MIINSYIYGVGYDPDAQLFITATGISGTNATAINQLVLDLKAASIWTKMKAIYPIIGGTASAHSYNLKNTAAFQITFSGGWTHSSTGALPNGVNAFANANFSPSVNSSGINNFHSSYYSRTDVNLVQVDAGCGSSDSQGTLLEIRTANTTYIRINAATTSTYADTASLGFYLQSRLLGNQQKGYKNSTLKITGAVNSNTTPTQNYYIGAYNSNGLAVYYSTKQCAFASIGDGLTDAEVTSYYTAVQAYNTTLARNV
jgi:hypothetical protein